MNDHYYTQNPASKLRKNEIEYKGFTFTTASSVFGKKKADKGSILLLENCSIDNNTKKVLDFGCGYGLIGISLKRSNPDIEITCSDINKRAVALTKDNAEANKVEITTIESDMFTDMDQQFDAILINLPQSAGKDICFSMIEESFNHLNKNGTLQTVSRHQKGGKQYEKKMTEIFGNCDYLAKGSGYRVYISRKD